MTDTKDYTIYAVKGYPPNEEGSDYWLPQIYNELKKGAARFGWGYDDDADLLKIKDKLESEGWDKLNETEKYCWDAAKFLLQVKPNDYFVYINMPAYGKCTIVKITGEYKFSEIWDSEKENDFRHLLPCEFIATFDRNDDIVPPYLRTRLTLRGRWYRISAVNEFDELLISLKSGLEGQTAKERLVQDINSKLLEISERIQRHYPRKDLENLLIEVFRNLPNVKDVRRGPDYNGADLEIEFETGLFLGGLQKTELCAVQVKSYEGTMGYTQAVEDIRRAFNSNPSYDCGLIVSTALEITENFEKELEKLRIDIKKDIGILIGKDLAYTLIKLGFIE
uniref:Restriction endonuclease type IV Mrr domain-containing protein n=1 Tax=Desulfobacca acetoxidans TaxID=60893 RepID=A0A7V4G662_9BACT